MPHPRSEPDRIATAYGLGPPPPPPLRREVPVAGLVIGVLLWATLGWILGHPMALGLSSLADSTLSGIKSWTSHLLFSNTSSRPDFGQVLASLVLAVIQIPLVLVALGFALALGILAALAQLLDGLHLFPLAGAIVGFIPGWHSRPFWTLGQRVAAAVGIVSVSTVEVFTLRGATNRLWAASPLLVVVGLALIGYIAVMPRLQRISGSAQAIERYRPTPAWQTTIEFGGWRFELKEVILTPNELEARISATNLRKTQASFVVAGKTSLRTAEGIMNSESVRALRTDIPRTVIAPGQTRDVIVYFTRPEVPHRAWRMRFIALNTATKGVEGPFTFDLSKKAPGS